ncbi:VOC family protein [Microbacterium sp. MPKO10]|uniref:VOC family protein n=1 Tax=Microbacterium sp. MPKO10 TaxID=2989818 RepID=UPI002236063A|nr:VOC family protein [Microbacterium sp. MPKO10]MCW4457023.1 VOC family protein [Microbacterium sp. MPKO10]
MDQNVHFMTIASHDLDATRQFYETGAMWASLLDVPGEIIFYQVAPGTVLSFFDADKFAQDAGLPAAPAVSGVTLAHNTSSRDDVKIIVSQLEVAGGTVSKPAQDGAFGGVFHAHVTDPNGVIWEIAHNPFWDVADDGTVLLSEPS